MGTRQRNRLVSAIAAKQQLPPRRGFLGTRSGKPHARDPPLTEAAQWSATQQRRQGKTSHRRGRKRREGDAGTSPSLNVGLAKLVQLQLATLPGDLPAAYPLVRPIWPIGLVRTAGAG